MWSQSESSSASNSGPLIAVGRAYVVEMSVKEVMVVRDWSVEVVGNVSSLSLSSHKPSTKFSISTVFYGGGAKFSIQSIR